MAIRKEVYHLAEDLAAKAKIDVDSVYEFLMDVGRDKGLNPRKLVWIAGPGTIFLQGERDNNCLQAYAALANQTYDNDATDYWYDRIMARQESWYDD